MELFVEYQRTENVVTCVDVNAAWGAECWWMVKALGVAVAVFGVAWGVECWLRTRVSWAPAVIFWAYTLNTLMAAAMIFGWLMVLVLAALGLSTLFGVR